jgi:ribosomal protein S12 methylthiotransferase
MNLGLITLGCTKNQVDSEMLLGFFKEKGFNAVSDVSEADVILVNTCGFIESAKKEAIDTILDMIEYKEKGRCKHLIVTGCLAKRYKKDILKNIPEVDLVIGVDEYSNIDKILSDYFREDLSGKLEFRDRIISSNFPMAYIRISDGCDNRCSYCAIPLIRGGFKSRAIEDILEEVKLLASQGISEFVIISQDTSKYGLDIYGKLKLAELLNSISKIDGVKWIRILYMYLYELNDELLLEIKNNDKICKYFDIPIQHINDKVLKDMNRKDTKQLIYNKINKIKEMIPEAILRTTIIVGFPGESDSQFEELLEGIKDLKFDRLGAFTYSKEEDTKAFDMDNQIDDSIKRERLDKLLTIQRDISLSNNKNRVGNIVEVLVEGISEDEKYFIARSYMDAPDVDGKILIKIDKKSINKVIVGEYIKVKIIDYSEYDLFAEIM